MNNLKYHLSVLIVFICLLACNTLSAQSLPSNVNVDQYSEDQIKSVMQQGQAQGLNDEQIVQRAIDSGMPSSQALRLQVRMADIRRRAGNGANDTTRQSSRQLNYKDTTQNRKYEEKDIFDNLKPKIFGADLFRNSNPNTFEPNLKLATPINYIVGPDDQIKIAVYGNSVANWDSDVSPDGNINIRGVGVLKVAGKTIEQVTRDIKAKLTANNYAIDRGTNVSVSLGDIRSIKVIVQGQVVKPGTYTVPSLATVFNVLFAAGGPSDIGSFRQIEVIRNSKLKQRLDLYDFLLKENTPDNITLQDQDIIRVPTYRTRVELVGEVKIPAFFEVLPGETVQDLINFSGGFTDQAYTNRIKIDRISDQQHRLTDIVETDYKSSTPLRGDKYIVERILNRYENRVTIKGAVFRPGDFELQKGLTVLQLIENAGGLKEDAFSGRGSIVRLNPNNTTSQLSFNFEDILNKRVADIILQREDIITISSIFDLRNEYKVTINGQVRKPGEFAYADSMKVADLIIKAGGFTEGATSNRIQVSRRIFNGNPSLRNSLIADVITIDIDPTLSGSQNYTLKPFDIVSVYSSPGYGVQKNVILEGEVMYPGSYTIKTKDEKISDIIARAGGLTASADIDGSSLKRDNAAILGVDKSKVDTTQLNKERDDRLRRLQNSYKLDDKDKDKDKDKKTDSLYRNNFIGIDLNKILKKPGTSIDLILEDGDVLRIPKQQQIVKINGEVLYPSAVVYEKGKSFKEYILNAGGFSPKALKRGAYIVYPNGSVKGTRKFLFFNIHPRVKAGSEIFVSQKLPGAGNSAQVILGFTTGLATLGAIILSIIK